MCIEIYQLYPAKKFLDLELAINLYGWEKLQKLPVNNFEWIKQISQFNQDFIKNCNGKSDE